MRLISDIDAAQAKRIFDILYEETAIFRGFALSEVEAMSGVFKFLSFKKGDEIVKKDDWVDFLGIIVHGSAFITFEYANLKELRIGSFIGQMNAADFSTREKHLATITAKTDGIIAIIAMGELKMEVRKNPQEVSTTHASYNICLSVRFSKSCKLQRVTPWKRFTSTFMVLSQILSSAT